MIDPTVRPNGQKIKALRLALKWRQEDLARDAVCSKRTVENAEAGKRVKESVLIDIAAKLGVAVSELICDGRLTQSTGQGETSDVPHGRSPNPPLPPPTVHRGPPELHELHALDDFGAVGELTRRCYYKIENATLTICGTDAHLIIEKVTMFDDSSFSKKREPSHRLEGHGRYVADSASILYTVKNRTGQLSWTGVCVLNVPLTGRIHGYWMAAGHAERGRTVLGRLELKRKSLVRKSSEKAGGHDQREG